MHCTIAPKKPLKPSKPQALMGKKPAKFALEGKVWNIVQTFLLHFTSSYISTQEYQENEHTLVVDKAELSQAVNIFGCKNATIQIKGKVNAVTLRKSILYSGCCTALK